MSQHSNSSMTVTPQLIVNQIRSIRPLPLALQKLYLLTGDIGSKLQDIIKTISSDEILNARILQMANSSFYGFPNQISSLQQAISVIGFQGIRGLALSVSALKLGSGTLSHKQQRERIWRHSFAVASAARLMASQLQFNPTEDVFSVSILHDIGKLLLLQSFPVQYARMLEQSQNKPESIIMLENKVFQINHAQIGAMICRHWNLPVSIVQAVEMHHAPLNGKLSQTNSLYYILNKANSLVHCLDIADHSQLQPRLLAIAKPWTTATYLKGLLVRLPDEIEEIQEFLQAR